MTGRQPGRLVALGVLGGFALVALGNGLDRASATYPQLARYVPSAFAAEAWRSLSAENLGATTGDRGASFAGAALAADPIDPRSAALLGASSLAAGKPARADQAFRVAARFGWRDPLTQLYLMNAALNQGQPRLAALRIDALLRQAPTFPVRDMLIAQFFAVPGGAEALNERLSLRPAWADSFMGDRTGLALSQLKQRARVVAQTSGPPWGCEAVAPFVQRLMVQGGPAAAAMVWRKHCPQATAGIADPHFAALSSTRQQTAFDWNFPGNGNVSASPDPAGRGLSIRVNGPTAQLVAWQMLVLTPGRYRMNWQVQGDAAQTGRLWVGLSCTYGDRQPVAAVPGADGSYSANADIDAACQGRYLSVWAAPSPGEVRFDAPTISPLP